MGTPSLECPFCCNETFPTRESLKDHILDILNKICCPTCKVRFDNISELAEHLDAECETIEHVNIKNEAPQAVEEQEPEDGVSYMCVMCNVQFKSIEDHLEKYHAGEEVILETENGENVEPEEFSNEEQFELSSDPIDNAQLDKAENEQQYLESERDKTKRKHKTPITENYAIENGKIRKITEEEAAEISDSESIIQIHQCPKCLLQFPKLDHYIKHSCKMQKPGKKNKCVHCSAVFENHQLLTTHLKTHLKTESGSKVITLGPHTCDICNTMFPSFKSLRLHKRMHEPQKTKPIESPADSNDKIREMFVCHVCNNTYDLEYEDAHMKSHSEEDNFYCSVCNRKFLTSENLEMHSKAHTNAKTFVCSYCKKAFTNNEALTDHTNNNCHKRSYECQYCGRRFSRPCEKVKHERIHTGEKPHVCQICGKAFRVSYCLTLHMRTHSGSRPYECPQCNKRFKSHSVYNHHLLIHSDVRAYKCPYCPKAFKTSVQLAGHKNSHIKPFSCTECNRPFASLYAVRAHMETHKRENNLKFDCWICGATYARAFALKDHMKGVHAGETVTGEVEGDGVVEEVEDAVEEMQQEEVV